jgi:SAM-dependent methyltransferase
MRDPSALSRLLRRKGRAELLYWWQRLDEEDELGNRWYEGLFTEPFGLTKEDYAGKRVLDVGCGPRGSLEWADVAAERVGLDPLADSYLRLGADRHAMSYVAGTIENPPLPAGHFDVVASINSLDHVDDIERACRGLARVLAPGGILLILTELRHEVRAAEPQDFSWEVLELFPPQLQVVERRDLERTHDGLGASVRNPKPFDHANERPRPAVLVAKLRKSAV